MTVLVNDLPNAADEVGRQNGAQESATVRMANAIGAWMTKLDEYPGWKEWRLKRIGHVLYFDDPYVSADRELEPEFQFSDAVDRQHAIVMQYLQLVQAVHNLKECEFYFRRYPFRGLPVTRYSHITNVCEMYFGRFYEIKERLKKFFDALSKAKLGHGLLGHGLNVGRFIKNFEREFDQELRARNSVDHHKRFEDVALDRVMMKELASGGDNDWEREHLKEYRNLSKQWAQRVKRRGEIMDAYLEEVATATLNSCSFLSTLLSTDASPRP